MNLLQQFGLWDVLLLVVVSCQATLLAYLHHPKWKSLMLALPFPFTLATMAVGAQVGTTHMAGVVVLLAYAHCVRWLHVDIRMPVIPSIVLSGLVYVAIAASLAPVLPTGEAAFWTAAAVTFAIGLTLLRLTPHRPEPGHRTSLPVWIKMPVIMTIILLLIVSKKMLQGFTAMFPMVGLVAAYEARRSLWTVCRALAGFALCSVPMMAAAHVAYPYVGLAGSLAIGWAVLLCGLIPLMRSMWHSAEEKETTVPNCRCLDDIE